MPPRRRPSTSGGAEIPLNHLHPAPYLEPFLSYLEAECGMSANTVKAYRNDILQFIAWIDLAQPSRALSGDSAPGCDGDRSGSSQPTARGGLSLAEVDLGVLSRFLQWLHERGLKATTISRRLVALKMFFRYLVLEGVIVESVVDLLSSPKLWQYLPTVLSPEMVDRLLAAPGWEDSYPLRDRAVLTVLYATGCRASEVSGLRIQDIRLDQNYCRCLGKGNKERIVSINPLACRAVEEYLQKERPRLVGLSRGSSGATAPGCDGDRSGSSQPTVRGGLRDTDSLFVTRTGRTLTRTMIWHLVKKYAIRIGCGDKISPHTLRHSFATHMLAGGAEIRALQEMLGHASIRTTQIYTQVEHSRLKAIHSQFHPRG